MNSRQIMFIIFPFSGKSFTLLKEDISLFRCNLHKSMLYLSSFSIYRNVFWCSLLYFHSSLLFHICIALRSCFVSVFPFPLLPPALYSKEMLHSLLPVAKCHPTVDRFVKNNCYQARAFISQLWCRVYWGSPAWVY